MKVFVLMEWEDYWHNLSVHATREAAEAAIEVVNQRVNDRSICEDYFKIEEHKVE